MAPKKPTKTGGKAGAVPGRPGKPMAGLRDKTVRVPAAFNAKTVDPTNQRGAGQRVTGGLAGGRAGKPAGRIAGQAGTRTATATKPSGAANMTTAVKSGAVKTAANVGKAGARAALGRALVVGGIAEGLNENLNPNSAMNRRDAELLRRINDKAKGKFGDRFKNMNSGASAAKGAKPAAGTSKFAGARDKAMAKAKAIKGSPVVGPKPASAPARMSAPAARSSAPSGPKASAPKASAPKATAPSGPARMSASTYNRVSGNYGTSRSNNPLMADFKDSLPSKAVNPDAGYSPKTKVSSEGIKGAPTDVTKLAFSNPKLSKERTRKIKRG